MVANSDMAVCLSAVRPDLMALCDQLVQQLSQADQQRGRLLEAVLAELRIAGAPTTCWPAPLLPLGES